MGSVDRDIPCRIVLVALRRLQLVSLSILNSSLLFLSSVLSLSARLNPSTKYCRWQTKPCCERSTAAAAAHDATNSSSRLRINGAPRESWVARFVHLPTTRDARQDARFPLLSLPPLLWMRNARVEAVCKLSSSSPNQFGEMMWQEQSQLMVVLGRFSGQSKNWNSKLSVGGNEGSAVRCPGRSGGNNPPLVLSSSKAPSTQGSNHQVIPAGK